MSLANNIQHEIKKKNKSYVEIDNDLQISSRQRRKSCCCNECGKISSLQFKYMNLQLMGTRQCQKKLNKFQSIESTYMDSYDTNITSKMSILKIQTKQEIAKVRQINLMQNSSSFDLKRMENFERKPRTNSCCCDECGSITKFQLTSKSIALQNGQRVYRSTFRIKRNLDQIFRGISPIEKKSVTEIEEDENDPLNCNDAQIKRRSLATNLHLKFTQKQQQSSGRRVVIKDGSKAKLFFSKTNTREFVTKSDSNSPILGKKLNLPLVKSSYAKTRELLSVYEVQHSKFSYKLNNANPYS